MKAEQRTVLAVIPAGGPWAACWEDAEGKHVDHLMGWALVKLGDYWDRHEEPVGLVPLGLRVVLATDLPGFTGYVWLEER